MITKQRKQEIVTELTEKFRNAGGFYLVDFVGMNVEESIKIRRQFKKMNVDYRVAKNTLILRALKDVGEYPIPSEVFTGQTAIIFSYSDPVSPAKALKEQIDKFNRPVFKGAYIDGQFFDSKQLKTVASLPTKQDIMASIVGSLHAPISGIVGSINAVMRDLASIIEEVAKKQAA
ncbi:MAG: 50S ribosomal protein L10 [Ignavibacteriae bacterium]|nr:50S ribosomal protein L10 [Ignavibacteriota bacterium]